MRSLIITLILLVSISFVYLAVNDTISTALGENLRDQSPVLFVVSNVSVALTPIILYVFLGFTSYLMVQVFYDTEGIAPLLRDMWMSFIPILFSAVFSWVILQDMGNYDLRGVGAEEIEQIGFGLGITLPQLSIVSNLAYVLLYAIFIFILIRRFNLAMWQAAMSALLPSAMVWAIRLVIA
jgi:hypothetical protein